MHVLGPIHHPKIDAGLSKGSQKVAGVVACNLICLSHAQQKTNIG